MAKKKAEPEIKTYSLEAKDFYSDYSSPNMLYGCLIRSPASTGKVERINIPDLPENYFLFTAKDIPGSNKVTINEETFEIFAQGNVSYKGEVLGIIVGDNLEKVEELAQSAEISFDIDSLESAFLSVEKKYKHPAINISGKRRPSVADIKSLVEEFNDLPSLDTVQTSRGRVKTDEGKIIADRTIRTGLYKTTSIEKAELELFSEGIREFSGTRELSQVDSLWQETSGSFCSWTKNFSVLLAEALTIFLIRVLN